ncbi:carboxymuconolactone decarboxylase family protein [Aurantivibrio plasticivorans]
MSRIQPLTLESAAPEAQTLLNGVKAKIGMVPNLYATLAHAPAALEAILTLNGVIANGRLTASQREVIALAVGQANECQYCVSAHTLLGKGAGLSEVQIAEARQGRGTNALHNAIADLATKIVRNRGVVSDADLADAYEAGVDNGLLLEIVANVVANIFTNYTNHIADTDIDFPTVSLD